MIALTSRVGRQTVLGLAAASAVVTATAALAAPPNSMLPRYDGMWSVSIVTERGDCDRGYRYPIRISNGTLTNPGDNPFTISGKVQPTGAIVVTVSAGNKSATGTGRLAGDIGEGLVERRRMLGLLDRRAPRHLND